MKIVAIETHLIRVRCDIGAAPIAFLGVGWSSLDTLLVRVVTDQGLEGWGEGFGHACCPATRIVVDTQLAPAVLGEDTRDIRGLMARLAQRLHLFGRNGPHVYALSALDIALWDIMGKAANLPLWRLLGGAPVGVLPAYASLLRYSAPAEVAKNGYMLCASVRVGPLDQDFIGAEGKVAVSKMDRKAAQLAMLCENVAQRLQAFNVAVVERRRIVQVR
jgi:D-galactarolactone cycloisomerase